MCHRRYRALRLGRYVWRERDGKRSHGAGAQRTLRRPLGTRHTRRLSQGNRGRHDLSARCGGRRSEHYPSADGHPVATYIAACGCIPQPCPLSTSPQTLSLATPNLTDGTHTLTLAATDAAGNESMLPPSRSGLITTRHRRLPDWRQVQRNRAVRPSRRLDPARRTGRAPRSDLPSPPFDRLRPVRSSNSRAAGWPRDGHSARPRKLNIAVWLANAAGSGTAANATHTIVNVPAGGSAARRQLRPGRYRPRNLDRPSDPKATVRQRGAARTGAGGAYQRASNRQGARRLHRTARASHGGLVREDIRAQAWAPDGRVQAWTSDGGARDDPRERAARSRAHRHEHVAPPQ